MALNLPVILGSVRRDRIGIRVARFMINALPAGPRGSLPRSG